MSIEIADELKVRFKPRVMQHFPGVTTHRKYGPRFDVVMFVQNKGIRLMLDAALVDDRLTIVFTVAF